MSEQFRTLAEYTVDMEEPVKTDRSVIGNKLDQIAKEFNSQDHTPEVLSQTFQAIWQNMSF